MHLHLRLGMALGLALACTTPPAGKEGDTSGAGEESIVDNDRDGSFSDEDCNDSDSSIGPGSVELCDGIDNDCDGEVDEDVASTWYTDGDGDGYGDPDQAVESCVAPPDAVAFANDCDDDDPLSYPGAEELCDGRDNDCNGEGDEGLTETWYPDADGDGYGDDGASAELCEPTAGYTTTPGDCDDDAPEAHPGAEEVCDELDNDCDGDVDEGVTLTWYADLDEDGIGRSDLSTESCTAPTGYAEEAGDCDDADPDVWPGAPEYCNDIDDNCDGVVDEDSAWDTSLWYRDADADTWGDLSLSTRACEAPAGYTAPPTSFDCDDSDDRIYPGAPEHCNGLDDDCDSTVDEPSALDAPTWYADNDGDLYGGTRFSTVACAAPANYVASSTDCDDGDEEVYPGAPEQCNGADDDCDGLADDGVTTSTWYRDGDADGYGLSSASTTDCAPPVGYVAEAGDCDDSARAVNPDAAERCDGIDNDCDSHVDGDDLDLVGGTTWYADDDSDGYGDASAPMVDCSVPAGHVASATDCDDLDADVNPGEAEVCDEIDNDCDGDIDDDDSSVSGTSTWYRDADGDRYGSSTSLRACDMPSGYVASTGDCADGDASAYPGAVELCDGADDDCDSSIDEGVLGTAAACPAEDCAEIIADNPSASSGTYYLDRGSYYCEHSKDGGGWTRVKTNAYVYGTGVDSSVYNSEGFTWDQVLFEWSSGSVHAHCTYPESLTGCNNLGFRFGPESWGVPTNWGASICGGSIADYTSATTYIGGYDFVIDRSSSTSTIMLGTLEGIFGCTTGDNPGSAYVNIYVRR